LGKTAEHRELVDRAALCLQPIGETNVMRPGYKQPTRLPRADCALPASPVVREFHSEAKPFASIGAMTGALRGRYQLKLVSALVCKVISLEKKE